MSTEPKRVELTEAEREALFRAGDHHPDHCDCTAFADEVGYAPGSETCDALADTYDAVTRIKAAARREAQEVEAWRDQAAQAALGRVRELVKEWPGPSCGVASRDHDGCYVQNLLTEIRAAAGLAEPERDEEGGR